MQLHLVDATYELFRAFYSPRPGAFAQDGRDVGAVVGLMYTLLALLRDEGATHVGCATDHVIRSFRNELYAGYKTGAGVDLTPSMHWPVPVVTQQIDADRGPVLVTVEYRVAARQEAEYLEAMEDMRIFRRREGAVRWDLYRDLADPERFIESFVTPTWAEHMRTHERVTKEDQATEQRAFSFLKPGFQQFATHLIAARTYDQQTPVEPPYSEVS